MYVLKSFIGIHCYKKHLFIQYSGYRVTLQWIFLRSYNTITITLVQILVSKVLSNLSKELRKREPAAEVVLAEILLSAMEGGPNCFLLPSPRRISQFSLTNRFRHLCSIKSEILDEIPDCWVFVADHRFEHAVPALCEVVGPSLSMDGRGVLVPQLWRELGCQTPTIPPCLSVDVCLVKVLQ